ncbi:phosphatidate cytidylyltransferase [Rhodovulum sp. BSW8]|uniref:Phosphatidate cytidylyltransferase n=1 Tax=Rhodovulum visakhapatnamense TaxID=364297 RepID=A0A4R8G0P2_9RHOB|nr:MULTISPECIES: phosphatidate cytidylyltransferase [Rhodovulum]OLS44944.1 phosphatidate cytidylyltransferase [Rhodovulum sulfidophilum]MBL3568731.1 phosphatidate cytidylyltransferase [Rhodovulum visakhapatnamense]MBL3577759.1 phosphatidate cytidylyltransferase [Rhodovulum visakhapatnamense]RBO54604.1 phosphatidate cytidylyltransferase [Rhodovulum sp. BSW8]TDX32666.1 phosphatidate cytidylyltransferase [Rhodovulum visakhapatnamense]
MSSGGSWEDLLPRLGSAVVMAAVGILAVWLGGVWFTGLAALVSGTMVWELTRMMVPGAAGRLPIQMALVSGAAVLVASVLPGYAAFPLLLVPCVIGAWQLPRDRGLYLAFAMAMLVTGYGLATFRADHGVVWLVWLILVVIATDVAGYFAGRFIGGPKFWPKVSPKKTWSGILGGWFAAMLIGLIFLTFTNAGPDLPWISMLLSFASQMGDAAESALKRRVGVKDSSSLLPGHGGLFDRFDGLLGASLFMLLVAQLVYVPEVRF